MIQLHSFPPGLDQTVYVQPKQLQLVRAVVHKLGLEIIVHGVHLVSTARVQEKTELPPGNIVEVCSFYRELPSDCGHWQSVKASYLQLAIQVAHV